MTKSIHGRVAKGCRPAAAIVLICTLWAGDCSGQPRPASSAAPSKLPRLVEIQATSSIDGHAQPILFHSPSRSVDQPTPMLVYLHSWSSDYRQKNVAWQAEANRRGWIYLHPNFRGPNRTPPACGSKLARQDILDAIVEMQRRFQVDPARIYLAGSSGGGHMAMLMAGHHPDRFSAVSAWVGITDLAQWYRFHLKDGVPQRYAQMILDSLGGPPSGSTMSQYRDRSPIFHLHRAVDVPLDIAAGVNDGHTGSVPVKHSLDAFNIVARANGETLISDAEIQQLSRQRRLEQPLPSDTVTDKSLGRKIFLRRSSGNARVTIFDGGHEGLAVPACDWLNQQVRQTVVNPVHETHP